MIGWCAMLYSFRPWLAAADKVPTQLDSSSWLGSVAASALARPYVLRTLLDVLAAHSCWLAGVSSMAIQPHVTGITQARLMGKARMRMRYTASHVLENFDNLLAVQDKLD